MKANDLKLQELVNFSEGHFDLHGRRMVLHSIDAFAHFRKDLTEMVGLDATRKILTRFGYFWGQADAAAMKRIFKWANLEEWIRASERLHTIQGVVKSEIKSMTLGQSPEDFEMKVVWRDSGEAQEHLLALGQSELPVCWMLVGYVSGYLSFCLDSPIYFIEEKCVAKGDRVCSAVGKSEKAWGERIVPDLPFFQPGEIEKKIRELTEQLKNKGKELARERARLKQLERLKKITPVEARSRGFRMVLERAHRVAKFDSSVLITGESGVGKEVVARIIHAASRRSGGPFVAVNCGALPETLLESELFGHKKGSFTGAANDRIGLFEEAAGGSVFLDEIGDITPLMQVKLLRVLQEREIMRVGESKPRKIDIRIISATNRNLEEAIESGDFRDDLFYRLRVVEIDVPPLRERKEDILPLARYFVEKFAETLGLEDLKMDSTCVDYLQDYSWPGNVRELENAIERAAVLSKDSIIRPENLPPGVIREHRGGFPLGPDAQDLTLEKLEQQYIAKVLKQTNGNKTEAAKILGISPTTLWRKLKQIEEQ